VTAREKLIDLRITYIIYVVMMKEEERI